MHRPTGQVTAGKNCQRLSGSLRWGQRPVPSSERLWRPQAVSDAIEAHPAVNVKAMHSAVLKCQNDLRVVACRYTVETAIILLAYALGLVHMASRSSKRSSLHAKFPDRRLDSDGVALGP